MKRIHLILAEFDGQADIPLAAVAPKYFGLDARKAAERAGLHKLPIPAYRAGSRKSPWLVSAQALADYLDTIEAQARAEWEEMQRAQSRSTTSPGLRRA